MYYWRRWPTPEQFQQEYNRPWPDTAAVYYRERAGTIQGGYTAWSVMTLDQARNMSKQFHNPKQQAHIACACTPSGEPPHDWEKVMM